MARMSEDAGDGRCRHCGTPLVGGTAFLCMPGGGGQMQLPKRCPSAACQEARDEALLAKMVERGIIDP